MGGAAVKSAHAALLFQLTPPRDCRSQRSHVALSGEIDLAGVDRLTTASEWLRLAGHLSWWSMCPRSTSSAPPACVQPVRAALGYAADGGGLTLAGPTSMIDRVLVAIDKLDLLIGQPGPRCAFRKSVTGVPGTPTGETRMALNASPVCCRACRSRRCAGSWSPRPTTAPITDHAVSWHDCPRGDTPIRQRYTRHCAPGGRDRTAAYSGADVVG